MSTFGRELSLRAELGSVKRARHFVRDVLLEWDLEGLVDDAQLGTSELVANAVRHAGTPLHLTVTVDGVVTIAIHDGDPELRRPVMADADELAESGRGLYIVAAISRDWGITTAPNGKIVWFNLALPSSVATDAAVLSMQDGRPVGGAGRSRPPASAPPVPLRESGAAGRRERLESSS